jgi:sugar O-acyltransferase (sialic acid O-acetyltransferase NeuD family)
MTKQNIVLIGGGGHCRSAIDIIETGGKYNIVSILDLAEKAGQFVMKYKINGTEETINEHAGNNNCFAITLGFISHAEPRKKIYEKVRAANGLLPVIHSPFSVIASSAVIGESTMIFHRTVINSCVTLGVNNIINTGAIIEHDTVVGNHNHISTGTIVNGGCRIGNDCFIGSGAVIREGVSICDEVIVGAGSVITKHITEKGIYYGNPGRKRP